MGFRAILLFFTLGSIFVCQAQSFQVDTTFQPFFDIRNQRGAQINDIYESNSKKLYLTGEFDIGFPNGSLYRNLISIKIDGIRNIDFTGTDGGGRVLFALSDSILINGNEYYDFLDTNGNWYNNQDFFFKLRETVTCATGLPYFFPDGSSLFANGRDNSGEPCDIGLPDSTNPGSHIMKLTPEGLWDSTFKVTSTRNPRGFFRYDSNRIIIYGNPKDFKTYNGVKINGMCRIFLNGRLDTSFHSPLMDTSAGSEAIPTLVQEDGSFLLHGIFLLKESSNYQTLAKINADGSLDTNFMNFSGPTDAIYFPSVNAIAPVEDGGYLVGGRFDNYQGVKKNCLAKIDSIGKLQPQFFTTLGPDSGDLAGVYFRPQINVIEKSKFVGYYVGGWFTSWDKKPVQPIIRLTDLDTTDLIDTNTSVQQLNSKNDEILIYPNPTNGIININSPIEGEAIQQIRVFDFMGREQSVSIQKKQLGNCVVNINHLANGIYFLQAQLENGATQSVKLVKK